MQEIRDKFKLGSYPAELENLELIGTPPTFKPNIVLNVNM